MTDRDLMEMLLELMDECRELESKISAVFNRVYFRHLEKMRSEGRLWNGDSEVEQ